MVGLALCVASACARLLEPHSPNSCCRGRPAQAALEWFALLQAGDAEQSV